MDDRRRPPRRIQTSDDRDAAAAKRRRTAPQGYRTPPLQAPPGAWDREDTAPQEVLRREVTEDDLALARELGRDLDAPVSLLDFARFWRSERQRRDEQRSGNKEFEKQLQDLRAILDRPPHEAIRKLEQEISRLAADRDGLHRAIDDLTARVGGIDDCGGEIDEHRKEYNVDLDELRKGQSTMRADLDAARRDVDSHSGKLKVARAIAIAAISTGLAALGGMADKMWNRAETEGAAAIRMTRMESDVTKLQTLESNVTKIQVIIDNLIMRGHNP